MFVPLVGGRPLTLAVFSFSRLSPTVCRGGDICVRRHIKVGTTRKRRDNLEPGCYVMGPKGKRIHFDAGWYTGYHLFRHELARCVLNAPLEDVWDNPRRFKGAPFLELLDFPDRGGKVIGPDTSAKLQRDFAKFATVAKVHFLSTNPKRRRRPQPNDDYRRNCAGFLADAKISREVGQPIFKPWEVQDFEWMWTLYGKLRRSFQNAADGGLVKLY